MNGSKIMRVRAMIKRVSSVDCGLPIGSGELCRAADLKSRRLAVATLSICAALLTCGISRAADADPAAWTKSNLPQLIELYKQLHQSPELSLKEKETSARMAKE